MCGFAGCFEFRRSSSAERLRDVVGRMNRALSHRGPDDEGVWLDAERGIALGHRRLSIVDLSPAGHQPMVSGSGRYVIAYNGEIYNHRDLRRELEASGTTFRGNSDTEVIVEGSDAWTPAALIERINGMFAYALWDRQQQELYLVRDRLGIKPLYWGYRNGWLLFGSELKAFRAHDGWEPRINRGAIAAYLRHTYIPAPFTVYEGVHKLEPGTFAKFRADGAGEPIITRFWDLQRVAEAGLSSRLDLSDAEAVDQLHDLLKDAVGRRMLADVPLGAFLSGGVDSSTVAALMQAQSSVPVRTYSIGFGADEFNEAPYARAVAEHLGTDHTELYVTPKDGLDTIPELADWYDEPFADSSQIPTLLLSKLTRRHVTVALSGDGGDELFAGYTRYFWALDLNRGLSRIPQPARRGLARALRAVPSTVWTEPLRHAPRAITRKINASRIEKLLQVLGSADQDSLYRQLLTLWVDPERVVLNGSELRGKLWDTSLTAGIGEFLERMQFLDTVTYLPDDILTKVDRASMAVALEVRVPIIDYRVVEFSWRLPVHQKVREGTGKWILRKVLDRYVPRELIDRPKMGFGVPIGDWLRGELREWAEDLLSERTLKEQGLLAAAPVRRAWQQHLNRDRDWEHHLWTVLMLQAWLRRWH